MEKKLFLVANRLPDVSNEKRTYSSTPVDGICSSNTGSFNEIIRVGYPGCNMGDWISANNGRAGSIFEYLPVFISPSEYEGYFYGHSNSVIRPLFHYFPSYAEYNVEWYNSYQAVNRKFAETLLRRLGPGDTVWIHDYHFIPLAALLREELPELTIAFFLEIPFPAFEIFRLLPRAWQENSLKGMLGADLVGFHTIDYASHFLQSVNMVMGVDNDNHTIHYGDRLIKADVFPLSIDYKRFQDSFDEPSINSLRKSFKHRAGENKIILSIDCLDYTKGVHNRLKAYEYFLQQNPLHRGKVILVMIILPAGNEVPGYPVQKKLVDDITTQINGRFGNSEWTPVICKYENPGSEEIISLYTACDIALITPLRDGINLASKEFAASRKDKQGVLIISEMAGAARELTDALIVNPNDIVEMARKIKEGLEMSAAMQEACLESMQSRIATYDIRAWANDCIEELQVIKLKQQSFQIKFLDSYAKGSIFDAYRAADKRLFLLDYDGTLSQFCADPDKAIPTNDLLVLIKELSSYEQNDVYLSGDRTSSWLDKHFGSLPVGLVAEHGSRYKPKNGYWITNTDTRNDWKQSIDTIMEKYVRRCANSFIEKRDFAFVWHYSDANVSYGKLRAQELMSELNEINYNKSFQVVLTDKYVEVRKNGVDSEALMRKIVDEKSYDFIFAAGDDKSDEEIFRLLGSASNAFSIKIGSGASYARFNLHTPQMVVSLLEGLSRLQSGSFVQGIKSTSLNEKI